MRKVIAVAGALALVVGFATSVKSAPQASAKSKVTTSYVIKSMKGKWSQKKTNFKEALSSYNLKKIKKSSSSANDSIFAKAGKFTFATPLKTGVAGLEYQVQLVTADQPVYFMHHKKGASVAKFLKYAQNNWFSGDYAGHEGNYVKDCKINKKQLKKKEWASIGEYLTCPFFKK
jgi:hypothetical protein